MKKLSFFILILVLTGSFISYSLNSNSKLNHLSDKLFALAPTPYETLSNNTNYSVSGNKSSAIQSSGNIEVLSPIANDKVNSSFIVKGNARTKNDIVYFRLYDSIGNVLTETYTNVNSLSSGNYGPFEKIISFNSNDTYGILEIFQYSDENVSQIDIVEIPLAFVK